ncbi:MAG: lycopene beta-cyclase CrtY, partial [Pseudomonadota bacterium]
MKVDIAIAGGGLAGALIAWRLRVKRPDVSVAVVERGRALGGNHTWSFHESDVPAETAKWLAPIVAHQWSHQEVRFPSHQRMLRTGYRSTTSAALHETVAPMLGQGLLCGVGAETIQKDKIVAEDGRVVDAGAVIDARGQTARSALTIGFQKFLGQELKFDKPHGLSAPIIMDATVSQSDGYRFIYVLPFTDDTALVEDTYYSDGADLKRDVVRAEIAEYCQRAGWTIANVIREEDGILPIALAGDIDAHLDGFAEGVSQAGLRAGLFHPLTGYSLPDAALLAETIADAPDLSGAALFALTR